MKDKENKLLTDFLGKNKSEIQDKRFSSGVLNRLPEKQTNTRWIVPLFTLAGIITAALLIDVREMCIRFFGFLIDIPLYYLLGGIMLFPVIFLLFYLNWEKNQMLSFKF